MGAIANYLHEVCADIIYSNVQAKLKKEKEAERNKNQASELLVLPDNGLSSTVNEFKTTFKNVNSVLNVDFTTDSAEDSTNMSEDEVSNFIEDVLEKVLEQSKLNLDENSLDIKIIAFAILLADDRTKFTAELSKEYLPTPEAVIEFNTIYKFLTGTKFFTNQSVIDLREVVTSQLMFDVTQVIYEFDDFGFKDDLVMSNILDKVRARLEMENSSIADLKGEQPIYPIVFNNNTLDNVSPKVEAKVSKNTQEYIKQQILDLMDPKFVTDNSVTIELTPRSLLGDTVIYRDTGSVTVSIKAFDVVIKMLILDLDTITGAGYAIEVPAQMPGNIISNIYVPIERFPEIIKKVLSSDLYVMNDPNNPESLKDFQDVINAPNCFGPSIYMQYDMSDMSKHIDFMSYDEFVAFGNNLAKVSKANWSSLGAPQYRMRIRNFKSPDDFTLVSDKNTRQQFTNMPPVFPGTPKRYFKDPNDDIVSSDILVCKFKGDQINVAVNGVDVPGIKIPLIPEAIDVNTIVK